MVTKDELKKSFAKEWRKHYQVELFRQKGFERRTCQCGNNFWTLDTERKVCGNPPCEEYGFIEKPVTKVKWEYVEAWKEFEKFFTKEKHTSIPRYPVVDRWRPDLYFTIASIQDFQRIDKGKMVFEYPANPLIVPQVCLRFPDIPNVGVTGRHNTSFVMPGQHAFGYPKEGYFKDRCLDLNFGFLHGVMGIPPKELVYVEDIWAMPDFSAFGPSIECMSRGLELVNHVFMEYTKTPSGISELDIKVNDTGWGHERLVWFSNGGPTSYEVVFGPVIKWMKKQSGIEETELFGRYAALAGGLDYEERNVAKIKQDIARKLEVSIKEIDQEIAPLQALYAIADHTKTLLFAITDGAIPSNVGGGYNLRVILRRALSFLKEHEFDIDLEEVAQMHAKHLKKMFPELKEGLELFPRIIEVEKNRYQKTLEKAETMVKKGLEGGLQENDLLTLYVSHGITPELVEKIAIQQGKEFHPPENFYQKVTEHHMGGKKHENTEAQLQVDVSRLPQTGLLYYENAFSKEMDAVVLERFRVGSDTWIALDKTVFYPEGGGQPSDYGTILAHGKHIPVKDVQKIGKVVLHKIDGYVEKGEKTRGVIDWQRREILMRMHDATHIMVGACRKVLGRGAWQAGAQKGVQTSRLDITHYKPFSQEELGEIERVANEVVQKDAKITASFMLRKEAEGRYGFTIYQGGASPGKEIRIVEIQNHDVQACGGTHGHSTAPVGAVKIIKTERIQDGVNRIEFTCGQQAMQFGEQMEMIYQHVEDVFRKDGVFIEDANKEKALHDAAPLFSVDVRQLPKTIEKFLLEIQNKEIVAGSLAEVSGRLFARWKEERRDEEKGAAVKAREKADILLKKIKNGQIFEILSEERKELVQIASNIITLRPDITVILANQAGEIVGMSKTKDMGTIFKTLCQRAGGSGGGNKELAQGKVELSKILKILG